MKKIQLDKYEQSIEDNIENYTPISKSKRKIIEKTISKANEKIRITLRINNQDLDIIKHKAYEEGLPYQTLISSVVHKYATEKFIDENNILKALNLIKLQAK